MKVSEYLSSGSFLDLLFPRFCMFLCLYEAQISESVYRTIGPLVSICIDKRHLEKIIGMGHIVSEMILLKYINK